jgi:uroporphyrinogen decarboxylase
MNSAQRFLTALDGGIPDRVPICELFIHPKIIQALTPGASYPEFIEIMGLDAISSLWMSDGAIKEQRVDDRTTIDEWGVTWRYGDEDRAPINGPIESLEDAQNYKVPDPDAPFRLEKLRQYVKHYKGEKAVLWQQRFGFMWAADLRRLENFLMDLLINPELTHKLMQITSDFSVALARNAVQAGADVVVFGDDLAFKTGPLMSPKVYKEFIHPYLQRAVKSVQEAGARCIVHSDGNIWPLLDMIVDTGVEAINPLEPVAGMDIGQVKEQYGSRVCLIGNIDCGDLLSNGRQEEVEQTVKETIRVAAPGGGYIMASSNAIHSAVQPQNYRAMISATHKYGNYPLDVN